jgi:PDZ domain-containing protein
MMAAGAYRAAREVGIDVPGDLSVIGYDDIVLAAHLHTSLTTVRQDKLGLGAAAAHALLRQIDDESSPPPASLPVELVVRRSGKQRTLEITPTINPDSKKPAVGIYTGSTFTFPFDVKIQLQDVGGPSAGMMMALGIYDKLTPGHLVGHAHIAGTGTIDPSGAVGAIGGIRQKMYGARDAGATWFLAPASNCNEVRGHVPSGLTVFAVKTLDDSLADVKAIASGADTSKLATCSRP